MIIVTGGAGFIGSALIWELNRSEINNIVVVDSLGTQHKWKNLRKKKVVNFIPKDELFCWVKDNSPEITAIFHMGACSKTTELDADYLMQNNVQYSIHLFNLAVERQIPFIYASSAATYGNEEANFSDDHSSISSLLPINKYGFSKHFFDEWVLRQNKHPPFWAGLKFFNVYGPNEYHKESQASVILHAFNQIRGSDDRSMKLFKSYRTDYPDGGQKRDFVYVKDIISVMSYMFSKNESITSGIYNIGSGCANTFYDLGRSVFSALKISKPKIDWIEMPQSIKNQYQYFTQANIDKLRNEAHYTQPFYTLEDGVADYIQNYLLHNPDPFL